MKIKVIPAKPVKLPPPTVEVTLTEAEARFVHKVLGSFSVNDVVRHLNLAVGSKEGNAAAREFNDLFAEGSKVFGAYGNKTISYPSNEA